MLHSMIDKRRDYRGDGNPKWRGNDAKYLARHVRVRTARGKAAELSCVECDGPAFEWSLIHNADPFEIQNYRPMCVRCHRIYDRGDKYKGTSQRIKPSASKGDLSLSEMHGEKHPAAKLTADQVREIRKRYADGEKQTYLAGEFGVLQGTISKICLRKTWKDGDAQDGPVFDSSAV
jgi:hypothetical protein